MTQFHDVRAVILAGGSGTRLWPLSRLQAPKQFLRLMGEESLLEATVRRLAPMIDKSQVIVVTNEDTASGEGYQILKPFEKILEPVPRNTAPAIGIAAIRYLLDGLDPVLIVLPSDHLIRDVQSFQSTLSTAIEAASGGKLVTFGITPTAPETGFGYIQAETGLGLRPVKSFHEKPDRQTAQAFLASGVHYWNSGMFVWRASAILREIQAALPDLARTLATIQDEAKATGDLNAAIKRHFSAAPSISIDRGVLERSANLYMVSGNFGWSDVGSWDAVYEVAEKDEQQNAIQGNVLAIECRNTLIRSEGRLVAVVDLEDISVIETQDAVLVIRRGGSQNVRTVVEELARRSAPEGVLHSTVQRPWGSFTVLEEGPGFKIKRIEVVPGGALSLQRHQHRSEHWVVIAGQASVTCGDSVSILQPNESTYIPIGTKHRLENRGAGPLQMIEVQVGSYVGEDDIERFDDQYGRTKRTSQVP
jgi:mannose-1-phosphate guanylyltransferase/mannose-6-phosphate isomerase